MDYIEEVMKLIDLSPCGIRFIRGWKYEGSYNWEHKIITIDSNMSYADKIFTISHEVGHAICDKDNCICYTHALPALKELHAQVFSLKYLYKHNIKKALIEAIKITTIVAKQEKKTSHSIAFKQLIKYKLFAECIKMANSRKQLIFSYAKD